MLTNGVGTAAGIALLFAALPALAADTVPADTSGNGLLNGKYWVRQVSYSLTPLGAENAVSAASGAMTFDGMGHYTFLGQGQDNLTSKPYVLSRSATYRVGANGVGSIDSLSTFAGSVQTVYGGVGSNGIFTGSSTESFSHDMFVAIPAGQTILTSSALQGSFVIGHMDFPGGDPHNARNSLFQVTADGQGGFGAVSVTGRETGPVSSPGQLSQAVSAASYSFSSDGSATLTFPVPAGASAATALFTGTKTLYVSADGNYLLGGDPAGYDLFFGFRPIASPTPAAVTAAYLGVYYYSSVDSDMSDPNNPYFVSEYGSINALQNLNSFWHQRTSIYSGYTYDFTYDSQHTVSPDGSINSTYYKTVVSADGQALLIVGNSTDYTLLVAVHAPSIPPSSGVFLSPLGILNAASYSPITNPVIPGELVTLFGTNLTGSPAFATASTLPFPSSLAGVQVMINDRPAALLAVSPTQISAIVPYATSGSYAKIQVINNGTASNIVTLFNRVCSPGVFAVPATGSGYGAILHANFEPVSADSPAKQGEVVLIYLTGLGAVTPAIGDGDAGPLSPLSTTVAPTTVYFGPSFGTVQYSGLAPGAVGLYQLNVEIPPNAPTGDVSLDISAPGCEASQVRIPIVAGP